MPTSSPDEARRVCTYLSPERLAELEAAATRDGLSVSAFIRRLIVRELQEDR